MALWGDVQGRRIALDGNDEISAGIDGKGNVGAFTGTVGIAEADGLCTGQTAGLAGRIVEFTAEEGHANGMVAVGAAALGWIERRIWMAHGERSFLLGIDIVYGNLRNGVLNLIFAMGYDKIKDIHCI